MKTFVKCIDGVFAVMLPAEIADAVAIDGESEISIAWINDVIVMRRLPQPFSRERFIRQARARDPSEQHPLIDFGPPQGSESGGPNDPARDDKW
jgi:antitoxin MazE